MPHAIWKGAISFGLVTIPVALYSGESRRELAFHMLDRRDMAQVRQKRVNEVTGEEVPWDEVVKGYEAEEGRWVVVTDDDFRAADVEATQTIDIVAFVDAGEIGPEYYDHPYLLEPLKPGRKAYALLRETLARTGLVGVARFVIRSRQHYATLSPLGPALLLDVVRYPYELRSAADLDLPSMNIAELEVVDAELAMAEQLVRTMEGRWDPSSFVDTYRDSLLVLIERKVEEGEIEAPPPAPAPEEGAEVVDIMELLKKSVEGARKAESG